MSVTLDQLAQSYQTIQQQQATIQQHAQTIQELQAQLTSHKQTLDQVSAKWNALEDALKSAVSPASTRTIPPQSAK
jgi:prefoldin subunit 5